MEVNEQTLVHAMKVRLIRRTLERATSDLEIYDNRLSGNMMDVLSNPSAIRDVASLVYGLRNLRELVQQTNELIAYVEDQDKKRSEEMSAWMNGLAKE